MSSSGSRKGRRLHSSYTVSISLSLVHLPENARADDRLNFVDTEARRRRGRHRDVTGAMRRGSSKKLKTKDDLVLRYHALHNRHRLAGLFETLGVEPGCEQRAFV